jgi:hypothetical protein
MNKQDLSAQTKVPGNNIDEILAALSIPKDLPDYTDEHVKFIQSIQDIHKNEGCKSWAEAVDIYRKPLNEAQLNEIALRHSMSDRIPEIITALKLKTENISTEQFEQFKKACEQLQQGMELPIVAQGLLDKAKPVPPRPFPGSAQEAVAKTNGKPKDTELVVAPKGNVTVQSGEFAETIPDDVRETIAQFPRDDAQEVVLKSPGIIADAIDDVHDATEEGLTQFVKDEWFDEYRKGVTDPDFAKQVREALALGKSQRDSRRNPT